jgi:flagellar biosynthetic protein FliR
MESVAILFLLVLVRTTALVMTAPLLGSRAIPIRFRVGIGIVLSLITLPMIRSHTTLPESLVNEPAEVLHLASAELVIGFALGLGVSLMFAAAQMSGTLLGQMAGIQISDQLDPTTGQSGTPVSQFFSILSLATFALMGGPELVLSSLLNTFVELPVGVRVFSGIDGATLARKDMADLLIEVLRQSFLLTLRAVGPAVVAMMISTVTISMIGRSCPQMNLSGIGFGSNVVIMLLAVFLFSGGCVWLFVDDLTSVVEQIQTTLVANPAATVR